MIGAALSPIVSMNADDQLPDAWKGPENLRKYYIRCVAGSPNYPHWAHGVEVCDRWLELHQRANVAQSDVDELIARLRAESKPGSMWSIMTDQIGAWAKQRGFTV
jgi:hypothetical protein